MRPIVWRAAQTGEAAIAFGRARYCFGGIDVPRADRFSRMQKDNDRQFGGQPARPRPEDEAIVGNELSCAIAMIYNLVQLQSYPAFPVPRFTSTGPILMSLL